MPIISKILQPSVAGSFYPAEPEQLKNILSGFFEEARSVNKNNSKGDYQVIIAPHAGYIYSGLTAAHAYQFFNPRQYEKAIILGPAHKNRIEGLYSYHQDYFETPLGISRREDLGAGIILDDKAFDSEHSVEVQIPFLQYRLLEEGIDLENYSITPIIYGNIQVAKLAKKIEQLLTPKTFLVLSSDLSHFHKLEDCKRIDEEIIESFLEANPGKVIKGEACGRHGIAAFLESRYGKSFEPEFIHYSNSQKQTGDSNRVVGYCAIGFTPLAKAKNTISEIVELHVNPNVGLYFDNNFQKDTLNFLREVLKKYLQNKDILDATAIANQYTQLNKELACFVTLNKNGQLRGCIGSLVPSRPLHAELVLNTIRAAFEDTRFKPLEASELDQIDLEVSILSSPRFLRCKNEFDLLNQIEVGKHGLILQKGSQRGTFLPQVWEKIPNKVNFLNELCRKAGLKPGAWKNPKEKVQVFVYEVISFKE